MSNWPFPTTALTLPFLTFFLKVIVPISELEKLTRFTIAVSDVPTLISSWY